MTWGLEQQGLPRDISYAASPTKCSFNEGQTRLGFLRFCKMSDVAPARPHSQTLFKCQEFNAASQSLETQPSIKKEAAEAVKKAE